MDFSLGFGLFELQDTSRTINQSRSPTWAGPFLKRAGFLLSRFSICSAQFFAKLSSVPSPKIVFLPFPIKPGFVTMCSRHNLSFAAFDPGCMAWLASVPCSGVAICLACHDRQIYFRFRPIASRSSKAGDSGRLAIAYLEHRQEPRDCQHVTDLLRQA